MDIMPAARSCSDFWYSFYPGERIGVVGPNGAGKSTMLNLIAGSRPLTSGEREIGETTAVGFFQQEPPTDLPQDMSMADYLRRAWLHGQEPTNIAWSHPPSNAELGAAQDAKAAHRDGNGIRSFLLPGLLARTQHPPVGGMRNLWTRRPPSWSGSALPETGTTQR